MRHSAKSNRECVGSDGAFTLIDLVVVIGVVVILAAMLLPALAGAKMTTMGAACKANQKQLIAAVIMYAEDYNGFLPGSVNYATGESMQMGGLSPSPDATKFAAGGLQSVAIKEVQDRFRRGILFPYAKNVAVFHCPGDLRFKKPLGASWAYDSYARCNWVGTSGTLSTGHGAGPALHGIDKIANVPDPANGALIVEEADGRNWNNGTWDYNGADHTGSPWIDPFAIFHNTSTTFSFCDGHVEEHKWLEQATIDAAANSAFYHSNQQPIDRDYNWFQTKWRNQEYPDYVGP